MGLLKFLNASELRALVKTETGAFASDTTTKPGAILTAGDYEQVEYTLLERNSSGGVASPWKRIPVANYSLQIGLYRVSDRLELTFNDVWAADAINNKYTGTLNLNTPTIAGIFAISSADLACTLEIQIKDGTGLPTRVYVGVSTLRKGLISAVSSTVAAPEVAATQAWVKGNFLSKNWPKGLTWIGRDQTTGQPFLCYLGDDGAFHADPLPLPWPAEPPP